MNETEGWPTTPTQSNEKEIMQQESQVNTIYNLVASEFQVIDHFMEHGILTFHVQLGENSKEAFLRLVKKLEPLGLAPLLRKTEKQNVLRIIKKPPIKKSNILVNLGLFFATLATTFFTGYMISLGRGDLNPVDGGLIFMVTIIAILGVHEMGHKITAQKHGIEATFPYFIPGPPPVGTFGAVIMQKSLPPNRDALFDVGASGPIAGFIASAIAIFLGLPLSTYGSVPPGTATLPPPIFFWLVGPSLLPPPPQGWAPRPGEIPVIVLHPVAFAGWIGIVVTMLNLLPVGTLDGGHIAESLFRGKGRTIFLIVSVIILLLTPFWLMLFFVLFFSMYKHPGPLDAVSSLSTKRKIIAVIVLVIFVLSMPMPSFLY